MDESVQNYLKPLDSAARVLLRAADWIERHGWIQGELERGMSVCALGALSNAHESNYEAVSEAEERVVRALPAEFRIRIDPGGLCAIAAWNDAPGRTKEEVVAKFRAVALAG